MNAHSLIIIWIAVCAIAIVVIVDAARKEIIQEIRKLKK